MAENTVNSHSGSSVLADAENLTYKQSAPASFCGVLIFQIFCLSIALGGPWREVFFFLTILVIQCASGAIIWRSFQTNKTQHSLPELVAIGFVISYAIVGISQIVLHPIVGYSQIISISLPLVTAITTKFRKKNNKVIATITHSSSSTLSWLLLSAPVAMSFHIVELIPLYVVPLAIFLCVILKFSHEKTVTRIQIPVSHLLINTIVLILSFIILFFQIIFRKSTTAIALLGDDELFDFAHSRGYAIWGINENINFVGDNMRLYKFSQLWLGTIFESVPTSAILTTTVIPLLFFTLIGLALWSLSFSISGYVSAANISAVIIFLSASLPEPYMIERRPLYLISAFFLIMGVIFYQQIWPRNKLSMFAFIAVFAFVFFSTRIQFAGTFFFGILISEFISVLKKQRSLNEFFANTAFVFFGGLLSYVVFFRTGITNSTDIEPRPIFDSFTSLIVPLGLRVFIPLLIIIAIVKFQKGFLLVSSIIGASIFIQILVPSIPSWRYPIEIILILFCPLISTFLIKNGSVFRQTWVLLGTVAAFILGSINRLTYDFFKWQEVKQTSISSKIIQNLSSEGWPQLLSTFIQVALLIAILSFFRKIRNKKVFLVTCVFIISSFYSGVFLATNFRIFTSSRNFSVAALEHIPTSTTRWIEVPEYSIALEFLVSNSKQNDIFATNVHRYDEDYPRFGSSLILTSLTGRRSFAEAPNFDRSTPKDPRNDFFLRMRVSLDFPKTASRESLEVLAANNVKWFVVDLERTNLRDWEPFAKTEFINSKVAILKLTGEIPE